MAAPATIRLNTNVPFPALVTGTGPVTITKQNGIWTVGFNISNLGIQNPPQTANFPTDYLLGYDSVAKTFFQVPLSAVGSIVGNSTPLVISPPANSTTQGLLINQSISGSTFPGFAGGSGTSSTAMDGIFIPSDNGAVGAGILYDFEIVHIFGGSAATGGRVPIFGWLVQTAITNASNTNRNYTGGSSISDTRTGDGGTNTGAGALGAYFGANPQVRVSAAATNLFVASGAEVDNYGATGGTAKYNWGVNIANFTQVVGASSDAGLVFYTGGATGVYGPGLGWKQGISFAETAANGLPPIASSGTVIGTHLETLGTFNVTHGVDFTGFTFSGSAFKSNGFSVDGTGGILSKGLTVATFDQIGFTRIKLTGVNFNSANTDNAIPVPLPPGVSRYQVQSVRLNNASASISTATIGVFTGTGGGGQTIAANQAVTVTATAADTNNNSQNLTITNAGTEAYNDATLQVRIGTAQGSAATADVVIIIVPLT